MRQIKQAWEIKNKETLKVHKFSDFKKLRIKCKAILIEGIENDFKIYYYENGIFNEKVDISVYFNVDIISNN